MLGMVLNDWKMDPNRARAYGRYYGRYQNQSRAHTRSRGA
jgi:hypothetical protein